MALPTRSYPSKVILLGEYSVIQASQALAIPVAQFSGKWQYAPHDSQQYLHSLLDYLEQLQAQNTLLFPCDVQQFREALEQALYLQSNIPIGYGLGSSGALCAAVYDSFAHTKTKDWRQLKAIFAQMESHFHGASSGTDPLISYIRQAIHIAPEGIQACTIPSLRAKEGCFFLLNSGKARKSEAFIQWFVEQCKDANYLTRLKNNFIPQVDAAIACVLSEDRTGLFDLVHAISAFQYQYFQPMLTDALRPLWKQGLDSNFFKLKLCGAGGGGFFLGFTSDWERTQASIQNYKLVQLDL